MLPVAGASQVEHGTKAPHFISPQLRHIAQVIRTSLGVLLEMVSQLSNQRGTAPLQFNCNMAFASALLFADNFFYEKYAKRCDAARSKSSFTAHQVRYVEACLFAERSRTSHPLIRDGDENDTGND